MNTAVILPFVMKTQIYTILKNNIFYSKMLFSLLPSPTQKNSEELSFSVFKNVLVTRRKRKKENKKKNRSQEEKKMKEYRTAREKEEKEKKQSRKRRKLVQIYKQ